MKKQDLQILEMKDWRKQMDERLSSWSSHLESKVDLQAGQFQALSSQITEMMKMMAEQRKEMAPNEKTLEFAVKSKQINSSPAKTYSQPVRLSHVIRNNSSNTKKEPFKRLSPQEIQYRRNNQFCWKCGEKWGTGHVCKLKQINVIAVEDEDDLGDLNLIEDDSVDARNLMILPEAQIQAITQMEDCWAMEDEDRKIIVILGFIHKELVKILTDTRASKSFINSGLARKMRFATRTIRPYVVTVADGHRIRSDQPCPEAQWSIQQYDIQFDLKVIELGEWDIILGTNWLSRFSPILFDNDKFTIQLSRKGESFILQGEAYEAHKRIQAVMDRVEYHKRKREEWQWEQELRRLEDRRRFRAHHQGHDSVQVMKHSSCSVQLFNKSRHYVAFKVKTTSPKKYCVKPNTGIMEPKSTFSFEVTMQAPRVAPDMTSKDKFLVQSTVVDAGTTEEEITSTLFAKDNNKYVEERKLKVILLSPPNSPVPSPMDGVHNQFPAYDTSPLEISQRRENMRLQFKVNDDIVEPKLKNAEPLASAKALDLQSMTSVQQLRLVKDINDLKQKINEMETKLTEVRVFAQFIVACMIDMC
ncbi:OLC1v1000680C2 [Oldenlandia corymbosa var. corymbosa]|uniref:OLC1v1000680C2 n=1 Tax=Oldenlandia corymbosa var. corymbosa TaxID=529605 RepID=A0AAV1D3I8_OLDCO|nr:OLC1v1000680C2 [Oldenlandia corymbosa var. corymbosa]